MLPYIGWYKRSIKAVTALIPAMKVFSRQMSFHLVPVVCRYITIGAFVIIICAILLASFFVMFSIVFRIILKKVGCERAVMTHALVKMS